MKNRRTKLKEKAGIAVSSACGGLAGSLRVQYHFVCRKRKGKDGIFGKG
ncbi:MAG: hypothetical protein ABIL22_04870 [candidate division WOR-3 bacterium]